MPVRRIGKPLGIDDQATDPRALLRAHGLRVTPQRRAILEAFSGGAAEHLSADEVHARASAMVPELGRGTVYATLAELTELGLLSARGSPEPVRYETNTAPHQHFCCCVCHRAFDVDLPEPAVEAIAEAGSVERVTMIVEGVCADCVGYDKGLRAAAQRARSRPSAALEDGIAAGTASTPVGELALGATPDGVARVVFANHADAPALTAASRARRGSRAARDHLARAKAAVDDYFAGGEPRECAIDWAHVQGAETLRAAMAVPRSQRVSYSALDTPDGAHDRGRALGGNPLAILVPCHRIMRGGEVPGDYVGGPEARRLLLDLERRP